jgi:Bifunctional DNA primase/polymerase, N-terminal/Primase C terminal 2 (PriCT-2)
VHGTAADPRFLLLPVRQDYRHPHLAAENELDVSLALEAALGYARSGLLVFPAPPGTKMSYKSARFNGGARWGATRDELQIRSDFARWPSANVCIVTGRDNGIFVIEIDTFKGHNVDGFAALKKLEEKHDALPPTRTAESPSGSRHFYFRYPHDGRLVRNDVGTKLGAGIDVRGDGGMVVAPPSARHDGVYLWLNNHPIAIAPEWLLDKVADFPRAPRLATEEIAVNAQLIAAAVAEIPVELAWHKRNAIGMAIFNALGDAGLDVWDAWLQRSGKYSARETHKRWVGIGRSPPSDIGAGTLIYLANQARPEWLDEYDRKLARALERAALRSLHGLGN